MAGLIINTIVRKYVQTKQCLILLRMFAIVMDINYIPQTSGPLYEELELNPTPECRELVNLNKNVAYGPVVK